MFEEETVDDTTIAVVGMSGRFPGADDYREFWRNSSDGVRSMCRLDDDALDALGVPREVRDLPGFVPVSSFLNDPDMFDAEFFGVRPREAELMDPQQRVFLESAWHALEDAGYDPTRHAGPVALYAGATLSSYLLFNLAPHHAGQRASLLDEFQLGVSNSADFLASRVAYRLNLTGPAVGVLTGCSSSLVSVHLAVQSLLCGESDLALAGGVSVQVNNRGGYVHTPDGIVSPDGHCRPFDVEASGTVFGSGVGVVVLKRLEDALADGDHVRAVIRGSATNNDGTRRAGFTAPGVSGQARVVVQAMATAGVAPSTIGYVETHGTATPLGDAIEIEALTKAFRSGTDRAQFCALGSAKANIGHLDAAAGVTGLIRAVQAVENGQVPPMAGHTAAAPALELDNTPFFVPSQGMPWPLEGPRRAAVSSFGIGGTNAHVVLEQAPHTGSRRKRKPPRRWHALVLSARSPEALDRAAERLARHLSTHAELALADVAHTLQVGRHVFEHRRHVLCRDLDEAVRALQGEPPEIDEAAREYEAAGLAWDAGEQVDWSRLRRGRKVHRVPLPGYPFERRRFWVAPPSAEETEQARALPTDVPASSPAGPPTEQESTTTASAGLGRRERIRAEIVDILAEVSGYTHEQLATDVSFFQLGLDSLALVQAVGAVNRKYGTEVPVRQTFENLPTVEALASYVERNASETELPAAAEPTAEPAHESQGAEPTSGAWQGGSAAERLMAEQLAILRRQTDMQHELMTQQLRVLGAGRVPSTTPTPGAAPVPRSTPEPNARPAAFVPFQRAQLAADPLTPQQRQHVTELVAAYTARTRGSRERTERSRTVRANHRNALNFRPMWKELVYPIFASGGQGGHITDVDGNDYVDLAMSFGATLLGHAPPFVNEAIRRELTEGQGALVGPCTPHAEPVARLISELTGAERVAFFNSGTEAVMLAVRLARAATGRPKIAVFAGSFHGTWDGTLARPGLLNPLDQSEVAPVAPGISPGIVADVLVLPYCEREALDLVRLHGAELAAVLVEPVQSRRPDLEPGAFLRELRTVTEETGTALVFDETITGFRLHPGGAQEVFGVRADLVTYGKVAGGGMPLGVVAGKASFMDSVDGGSWNFADDSVPPREHQRTFLGGTFCEHPLTMVAARAQLEYLRSEGTRLHERLEEKSARLAALIRTVLEDEGAPITLDRRASMFRFRVPGNLELFYYHLVHRGVYLWEGRTWFLSDAHTDEDIEAVVRAVRESLVALREGGFLTTSPEPGPVVERRPLTQDQRQMWFHAMRAPESSGVYVDSARLRLTGSVDTAAVRTAVSALVNRHEMLRTGFEEDGEHRLVHPDVVLDVPVITCPPEGLDIWWADQLRKPFRLDRPPLLRAFLVQHEPDCHDLVVMAHHLVLDGWSWNVVLQDLAHLYARAGGGTGNLPTAPAYDDYVEWQKVKLAGHERDAARTHWEAVLANPPAPFPATGDGTRAGARSQMMLSDRLHSALRKLARDSESTLSTVLLAAFQLLVHGLSGREEFMINLPSAGQSAMGAPELVGHCTNLLPVRGTVLPDETFHDLLGRVGERLAATYDHQGVPLAALAAEDGLAVPPISLLFNMDRKVGVPELPGFRAEVEAGPVLYARSLLSLNVVEIDGRLRLDLDYDAEVLAPNGHSPWLRSFEDLLERVVGAPAAGVAELLSGAVPRIEAMNTARRDAAPAPCSLAAADGEAERHVLKLWSETFGTAVGADSDFFDLGGNSLQATRLLTRVRREFGVDVPLGQLFRHRTPRALAALVESAGGQIDEAAPGAPTLVPRPRGEEAHPLSFGQRRLWYVDRLGADAGYVLFTAVSLRGRLDRRRLRHSLDMVVERHEVLRTYYEERDGEPVQIVAEPVPVPFDEVDLRTAGAAEQERLLRAHCLSEASRPFDLARVPLLRAGLVTLGDDHHVVVLAMHHIASDGWSLDLLLHEVSALYSAGPGSGSTRLSRMTLQYADYARWQWEWLRSPEYERQLDHWRGALRGAPLILDLPTDRPRPTVQTFNGAACHVRFPASLTARLRSFVAAEKVSLYSTALAAFAELLGLYTGQDEVLIGTPSANRNRLEVEPLIGFFVNMLVIRAELEPRDGFVALAHRVQDRVTTADAHQELPFDHLVSELLEERDPSRSPLFQVMFVLNEVPGAQQVADLEMTPLRFERSFSRFDLTLLVEDDGTDLLAVFEYNTDLFEAATVELMASRYLAYLRNVLPHTETETEA